MDLTARHRIAAATVAVVAWAAVVLLLIHQIPYAGSFAAAVWQDAGFFTDLGNLFVAIVFTRIAATPARGARPWFVGQALTAILLVALVYWTIGHGWRAFGRVGPGDVLAHAVTPFATAAVWLLVWPKGGFRWRFALQWALFPLFYLGYALLRGALTGWYPYPWMNVSVVGYPAVGAFAATITVLFAGIGALCVGLDRWLSR